MAERHLWRDWIAANALGEVLGLGVAAVIAIGVAQAHAIPPAVEILVVTAAFLAIGAYEGAIVGAAQWIVLRRMIPSLRAKEWIGATVAGAVVAWMLARVPSAFAYWNGIDGETGGAEPILPIVLLLSASAGAVLGLILGAAQWIVLRVHVRRAGVWIGANALAWAVGMPLIFVVASFPTAHTSALTIATLLIVTLAIAGAVVGAIEGVFLRSLSVRRV